MRRDLPPANSRLPRPPPHLPPAHSPSEKEGANETGLGRYGRAIPKASAITPFHDQPRWAVLPRVSESERSGADAICIAGATRVRGEHVATAQEDLATLWVQLSLPTTSLRERVSAGSLEVHPAPAYRGVGEVDCGEGAARCRTIAWGIRRRHKTIRTESSISVFA
jgi:hypothetical protein